MRRLGIPAFAVLVTFPALTALMAIAAIPGLPASVLESIAESRDSILILRTLRLSLGATALAGLLALAAGRAAWSWGMRGGLRVLALSLLVPPYAAAVGWMRLFTLPTQRAADLPGGLPWIFSEAGAILVMALWSLPFVLYPWLSAQSVIPSSTSDSIRLAMSPGRGYWRIIFPSLLPHGAAGLLMAFLWCLGQYEIPSLLQANTVAVDLLAGLQAGISPSITGAQSVPILLIGMVALAGLVAILPARADNDTGKPSERDKGKLASTLLPVILSFFALAPLLIMLMHSPFSAELWAGAWRSGLRPSLNSMAIAFCGAIGSAVVSLWALDSLQRLSSKRHQRCWLAILLLPLIMPSPYLASELIRLYNRDATGWIYDSTGILVVAHMVRFAPWVLLYLALSRPSSVPAWKEAANLSPGPGIRRRLLIDVPMLMPVLAPALLLAFLLGIGEIATTLLLVPAGEPTLSVYLYNVIHYGAGDLVVALCLLQMAAVLLFTTVLVLAGRLVGRRMGLA